MKTAKAKMACLTQKEIETKLRDAGVQPTLQRISICQYVLCEADHPTAEEVHAWAEKNMATISLATVYNTLNTLVSVGILREFKFPHTEKVIYDNNIDDHHHFLDEKSQKLFDIEMKDISISPELAKQYQVNGYDVILRGTLKK